MLNKKLLSYKTKTLAKQNKVHHMSTSYDQVESIGIIFSITDHDKHEVVKKFIKKLERDGKKVEVLAFLPEGGENFDFVFDFFTVKDVTFWGNFTSPQVLDFASKPFDYLFYLDDSASNPLIRNILAMSKAKCRIAKYAEENNPFCEMMIQTTNGVQQLADDMYKYTKILS